jgi:putative colanic acid biosynthesis acetyltransferase WcaF
MILSAHSKDSEDALCRPAFGMGNKIRRALWQLVCLLAFRPSPKPLHRWRCFLLKCFGARIGKTNFIYPNVKIWAPWLLETGDVVTLGPGVEVYNPGGVTLGHHTIVSQDAYLCGATHDYNSRDFTYLSKPITTEPYVWICAKAIVLPGVFCEEGSVLGAGSVRSRRMEAWTVYAGNPSQVVSQRKWK